MRHLEYWDDVEFNATLTDYDTQVDICVKGSIDNDKQRAILVRMPVKLIPDLIKELNQYVKGGVRCINILCIYWHIYIVCLIGIIMSALAPSKGKVSQSSFQIIPIRFISYGMGI